MSVPSTESGPPPGGPPPSGLPPFNASDISQDDKMMAMLAYILGVFTGFVGPLILWLLKKDQSKFVAYHALQALLLHAAVTVGYFLSGILMVVLIGMVTLPAFWILGLVFSILAGLAANKGDWYEIPVLGKIARQNVGI